MTVGGATTTLCGVAVTVSLPGVVSRRASVQSIFRVTCLNLTFSEITKS